MAATTSCWLTDMVNPGSIQRLVDAYGDATWTGINSFIRGIDNTTISNSWIAENIQQNHGPLGAENAHNAGFSAPQVDKPETAHFILKLTDKGTPALSRYKRVIVTIIP